ncbi:hypothetical protein DB30_00957 [Enhygromyxa salina]|uniref:Transmembrane protein n=1 Tax=Enhygromyxa salina TaxID=215803 RepID=A0A0C1Z5G1_9BACT|nr:hypothetical protein DB30_00957 [Enhygromyxa salina]
MTGGMLGAASVLILALAWLGEDPIVACVGLALALLGVAFSTVRSGSSPSVVRLLIARSVVNVALAALLLMYAAWL